MIRVHVICEGQTEEMFVNEVLSEFFLSHQIYLIPSLVGRPGHKGGHFTFERLFHDLRLRLLCDTSSYCTTFFDFYGLPEDFPGRTEALLVTELEGKQKKVTDALIAQLTPKLGERAMRRFIPYIQFYEFEGLLFSSPQILALELEQPSLRQKFTRIRETFLSPEHINNSQVTAPSKRIKSLCTHYDKVMHGSLIALEIGISAIRKECSLFDKWLSILQNLKKLP